MYFKITTWVLFNAVEESSHLTLKKEENPHDSTSLWKNLTYTFHNSQFSMENQGIIFITVPRKTVR